VWQCISAPAESAGRGTAPAAEASQTVRRLLAVARWLGPVAAVRFHAACRNALVGRSWYRCRSRGRQQWRRSLRRLRGHNVLALSVFTAARTGTPCIQSYAVLQRKGGVTRCDLACRRVWAGYLTLIGG